MRREIVGLAVVVLAGGALAFAMPTDWDYGSWTGATAAEDDVDGRLADAAAALQRDTLALDQEWRDTKRGNRDFRWPPVLVAGEAEEVGANPLDRRITFGDMQETVVP